MAILFDSSIYIRALRSGGDAGTALQRWVKAEPLWLSAVVLEELYAGTVAKDQRIIEKLERDFDRAERLLVPNQSDWSRVGKMLSAIGRKYGYERIGQSRLTNDALIAASTARTGIKVITANPRDFARLAEFCAVRWEMR